MRTKISGRSTECFLKSELCPTTVPHSALIKLNEITVYVDYRFNCGELQPTDKALRCRVVENWRVTGENFDKMLEDLRPPVFGAIIAKRSNLRSFSQARRACILELSSKVRRIVFIFHPLVTQAPRFNIEGLATVVECD